MKYTLALLLLILEPKLQCYKSKSITYYNLWNLSRNENFTKLWNFPIYSQITVKRTWGIISETSRKEGGRGAYIIKAYTGL